jgi:antitoxin VapB
MALSIKNQEAERLVRLVAKQTGESLTGAIEQALREKWERIQRKPKEPALVERLLEIANRVAALPVLDNRSDDEILGYDENGLPR